MNITGHTRLLALFGSPVEHSGSPAMYNYSFEKHKGYGTKAHIEAIKNKGAIEGVHRKVFLRKINNTWIKKVL